MKEFHLQIVTPDGIVFDGQAQRLTVRTTEGDVEILAGHTDYIGAVGVGRMRYTANGQTRTAAVQGGFLTVSRGEVRLIHTSLEFADEIDVERAERARVRAEAALREAKDARAQRVAEAKLARALNRLTVAGKQ